MREFDLSDAELARIVFENVRSHGVIAMRRDGTITAWALGAERIFGRKRESVLGENFSQIFLEADRAAGVPETELRTAVETGRAEDSRWHLKADGAPCGITTGLAYDWRRESRRQSLLYLHVECHKYGLEQG